MDADYKRRFKSTQELARALVGLSRISWVNCSSLTTSMILFKETDRLIFEVDAIEKKLLIKNSDFKNIGQGNLATLNCSKYVLMFLVTDEDGFEIEKMDFKNWIKND